MILRALAAALMLALPAGAQTFDAVLDTWLAGDDMAALIAFRALAEAGDADAQVFLGQIAT